ncbi:unnamed protein product [Miscanthus lutarioriparius]|uniref:Protein kinase domain-containing protein n=1 Tax=Miscanthus lutarioriparius TaxID=422564 RepID=A0A811SRD3_9POAL|nr:unnamed protein product [Miscanthus lutarioriparius]
MKKATRNFKDGVRRRFQEYLHFYCDPPLYHGDVKPSNVFLDKNYLAKMKEPDILNVVPTS